MGITEAVYRLAPTGLQDVLISLYGYARGSKRYGGEYQQLLREVNQVSTWSEKQVLDWQRERLLAMLSHCARRVPFYRELWQQCGVRWQEVMEVTEIRRFPILQKETVRTLRKQFRGADVRALWQTETSGSTGTPLTVSLDAHAYRLSMALVTAHEARAGIEPRDRRATFAGRLLQPISDDRPPFWRHNWSERQLLFSAYHLSERNLPHYIAALRRFDPAEVIGYPSAVYLLAEFARRSGLELSIPSLKAVITNSESLLQWQRSVIEDQFGVIVLDYYGSAESVVFAGQCLAGRYHPEPLMGIAEVLGPDDSVVAPGGTGRLVCTTLANKAMPLLRYDTGDLVTLAEGPCACGREGATWTAIMGRTDDLIETPSGKVIGRLDHIFKGASGIREGQIVQISPDSLELRIVPAHDYAAATGELLVKNAHARVGPGMRISVVLVSEIPRTNRGKFRGVLKLPW